MTAIGGRQEVETLDRPGPVGIAGTESGPDDFWKAPADRLLVDLATTVAGLTTSEARSRLAIYGPNDAATDKRVPLWRRFLARFRNHWSSSVP